MPPNDTDPLTTASIKFNNALSSAIKTMALVGDDSAKQELKTRALEQGINDWKMGLKLKVSGVGALTGVLGGPVGLLLEGFDIAYLLAACGQACYGVGHIKGRNIDYEADIPLILTIWAGAGEATVVAVAGKAAVIVGGEVGAKISAKVAAKLLTKVIPKVSAKISAKIASKMAIKWVPVLGGVVSAGINYWVANGLITAAESYYSSNYVSLDDELSEDIVTAIGDAAGLLIDVGKDVFD